MRKILKAAYFTLCVWSLGFIQTGALAQENDLVEHASVKHKPSVVDPLYGIQLFEPFNMILGYDTVKKNSKGMAMQGTLIEHYVDNKVIHEGYYIDGRLRNYTNFYPNSKKEREFKMTDYREGDMIYYFGSGGIKSKISYRGTFPVKWSEYNEEGTLIHFEKFDETLSYYESKKSFFNSGRVQYEFVLTNLKKLIFDEKEFYSNGKLKAIGKVHYDFTTKDYHKIKKWLYYDEQGQLIKTHKFKDGRLVKEKWAKASS